MNTSQPPASGSTRRGFLAGTAAGLAVGLPLTWLLTRLGLPGRNPVPPPPVSASDLAMPGPYRGRVIEVRHKSAVSPANVIHPEAVSQMVDRGMAELTGADVGDVKAAWGRFFAKGDVVGIKVNPVGRKPLPGEWGRNPNSVGAISSPALVVKVVECLKAVGLKPQDIILFERYANEFVDAGYAGLMTTRPMAGVRWLASAAGYSNEQVDIGGFDGGRESWSPELARHVAGYDPDVFTTMGFAAPEHSKNDDRRFRSHLSVIVSRLVNKVINLPVLKDHRSAGVTLALKNLSHGMNNNVARSHLSGIAHGFSQDSTFVSGPNQCNTFIPQAVSQYPIRQKATLHILDGLIGVYEGGPGSWNKTWGTWRHQGLFFATDPVALDHVGWDIIDTKRARLGWPPVERMGLVHNTPDLVVRTTLSALGGSTPAESAVLNMIARNLNDGRASEVFALRQPEHVILAGELGLGEFDRQKIWYRLIQI